MRVVNSSLCVELTTKKTTKQRTGALVLWRFAPQLFPWIYSGPGAGDVMLSAVPLYLGDVGVMFSLTSSQASYPRRHHPSLLVIVLLLWLINKNTLTKKVSWGRKGERVYFVTVPERVPYIMAGTMQQWEHLHTGSRYEEQEAGHSQWWLTHFLQQGSTFQKFKIFPNSATNWGSSFKYINLWGVFHIQTTIHAKSLPCEVEVDVQTSPIYAEKSTCWGQYILSGRCSSQRAPASIKSLTANKDEHTVLVLALVQ